MSREELQELIDGYLEGTIAQERLGRLELTLKTDAAAREHFVRYCRLHTDLALAARAMRAGAKALQSIVAMPHKEMQVTVTRTWRHWLSVAAAMALAVGLTWWLARAEATTLAVPLVVPHSLALDFTAISAGTLRDRNGAGTGLTHRLPGTGSALSEHDANLRLDTSAGQLEITTTRTDINNQRRLNEGEYLGFYLPELGFSGTEDFEITAAIPDIPSLRAVGQFGLYAGAASDRNIRGGLISLSGPDQYKAFLVNNDGGKDTDLHLIGLLSSGDDMRLTLRRTTGKYSLTVENQSTGGTSTLMIRHPGFLDGRSDIFVGLFAANTRSNVSKTLIVSEVKVTVWKVKSESER